MNPSDLQPKTELAYGGGIAGISALLHSIDVIDAVTRYATMLGAVFGCIVGAHAVYRLIRPRPRKNQRMEDRE